MNLSKTLNSTATQTTCRLRHVRHKNILTEAADSAPPICLAAKRKSVSIVVSVLSLFCSLGCTVLALNEFTVFAPGQDAAALAALSETLSSGKPGTVSLAKTIDEALKSNAEVLVFVMDMKNHSGFDVDISAADLKKVGQSYWWLTVANFDGGNRAKCRVNINYPLIP